MGIIRSYKNARIVWQHTSELSHCLLLAGVVCAADQAVKYAIETEPEANFPRELPHTNGYVEVQRLHNRGFMLGKLQRFPNLVKMLPLTIASVLFGAMASLCAEEPGRYGLKKLGLSMVVGGAASNLIDRMARGHVVDYLNIRYGQLKKLVLNLGDIAILLGGLLYMLAALLPDRKR